MLLGGGLQVLSIARGLSEYGYYVINCAQHQCVGKYSKFVNKYFTVEVEELDVDDIIRKCKDNSVSLIIPMEDEYALWLSNNKEIIEAVNIKIAVESAEKFHKVINKSLLMDFCRDSMVPIPRTVRLVKDDINVIADEVGFPALIKPDVSNGSRGIRKVENISQLKAMTEKTLREYGGCALQEYIDNKYYYNVMLYRYSDGTFSTSVATKITRFYPVKGGSSSFCTSVDDERLYEICKRLMDKLDWKGFADFDVLEKNDGDFRIIEINPRVPASVHAAYASGVNFGVVIADDLLNEKKTFFKYEPGKYLRYLGLDVAWFISSSERFRCSPCWFNFFCKNLYYQDGGMKDWKAMVYSFYLGIRKMMSPSFKNRKDGMN